VARAAFSGDEIDPDIGSPAIRPLFPKPDVLEQVAILRVFDKVICDQAFKHAAFGPFVARQLAKLSKETFNTWVCHTGSGSFCSTVKDVLDDQYPLRQRPVTMGNSASGCLVAVKPLTRPLHRKPLQQTPERHLRPLPPVEDRLDDVRRK